MHSLLAGWEFKQYIASTGKIIAWVLIPALSSSLNKLIDGCVGNSALTTFQGGARGAAFDSDTKLVYHFPNWTTLKRE